MMTKEFQFSDYDLLRLSRIGSMVAISACTILVRWAAVLLEILLLFPFPVAWWPSRSKWLKRFWLMVFIPGIIPGWFSSSLTPLPELLVLIDVAARLLPVWQEVSWLEDKDEDDDAEVTTGVMVTPEKKNSWNQILLFFSCQKNSWNQIQGVLL